MLLSIVIILLLLLLAVVLLAPIAVVCAGAVGNGAERGEVRCSWLHPWILKAVVDSKTKTIEVMAFGAHRLYAYGAQAVPPPEQHRAANHAAEDLTAHKETMQERPAAPVRGQWPFSPQADRPHSAPFEEPFDEPEKEPSPPRTSAVKDHETGEKSRQSRFSQVKQLWTYLGNDSFRGKLIRWLGGTLRLLLRICSVRRVRVRVRIGFNDPAATATAYGCYIGLRNMLTDTRRPRYHIVYEPAFTGERFEAEGEAAIATSVARLSLPIFVALATFPYLHGYLLLRKAGKAG